MESNKFFCGQVTLETNIYWIIHSDPFFPIFGINLPSSPFLSRENFHQVGFFFAFWPLHFTILCCKSLIKGSVWSWFRNTSAAHISQKPLHGNQLLLLGGWKALPKFFLKSFIHHFCFFSFYREQRRTWVKSHLQYLQYLCVFSGTAAHWKPQQCCKTKGWATRGYGFEKDKSVPLR